MAAEEQKISRVLISWEPADPGSVSFEDDFVVVDVTLSEDHEASAELTDVPIETGATVSDHRRTLPRPFKLRGLITDTPLEPLNLNAVRDVAFETQDQVEIALRQAEAELPPKSSAEAYDKLSRAFDGASLFKITTELRVYTDMMMTGLSVHKDPSTGFAMAFDASFRAVIFADTKTVDVKKTAVKSGQTEKPTGTKPGEFVGPTEPKRSLAKKALNSFLHGE